jgi:hypothetical protein
VKTEHSLEGDSIRREITRRHFLRIAAAGVLAGCSPAQQPTAIPTSAPTDTPRNLPTPAPTATAAPVAGIEAEPTVLPEPTPVPTATDTQVATTDRPDVIKMYPDVPSKVIHTHHAGVWNGEILVPEAIREMLDTSITELTGLGDATAAWAALFSPDERIAIKVNVFRNSLIWTHVPLVTVVVDRLQEAGIPDEQIVIFDYYTSELEEAGYPVNKDGSGVRCYGTDQAYTEGWEVLGRKIRLSDILVNCDALINIPILKSHMIAGISFAMKNHYGSLRNPSSLHGNIGRAMAELNALPPIKDRTRLIIGDVLTACLSYRGSYPYWETDWVGDSILMSFDPIAHDTVGLEMLSQLRTANEDNPTAILNMAAPCLESGAELGLGTNDPGNMEVIEVNLG